jgi:hypothetical protein
MLFFPEGETDMTTSALFPQERQSPTLLLNSALAATSVFDFTFPAMVLPPFFINPFIGPQKSAVPVAQGTRFPCYVSSS